MSPLTVARPVDAPLPVVWSVVSDVEGWAGVLSAVRRVERTAGAGPLAVGTAWRETRGSGGREETQEMTVVALEPGRGWTAEARAHGAVYRSTLALADDAPGRCRLVMTFGAQAQDRRARLLSALTGWLAAPLVRRQLQADARDWAAAAEARS